MNVINHANLIEIENSLQLFSENLAVKQIIPFGSNDTSVGMEYEMQVAVSGKHQEVDLPSSILSSKHYQNIAKRTRRGDLPSIILESLDEYLYQNDSEVWENSWVQFDLACLSPWTRKILDEDLLADKKNPCVGQRGDVKRFIFNQDGVEKLRVPISYLLKLSLANALSTDDALSQSLVELGCTLMAHLTSDNTSPEILSFSIPVATGGKRVGDLAAYESARTFLFCQLLIQFANKEFGLEESGQKCILYSAPHAPHRQKQLNEIVPEGFYRHLFISPCLSGWDKGEEKYRYMQICHKALSQSQLNTVGKLKDAGIITNNLIVLPNTSTTCLANNGTHVSIGSMVLSSYAKESGTNFTPAVEKYIGDLTIKIVEHFMPLFVNTYSASPYRLDFADFHPEKVLGFLPHELDYTHLRMIWRRWKKKADLNFCGRNMTPFGPRWLDDKLASLLGLKGDLVPDFRLIDFLVSLLSTESSPALNGVVGNQDELKQELTETGIFDSRMSIYLLFRQRLSAVAGYSGFEGRIYSLFHSLIADMSEAVNLQNLITALAYRYVLDGTINHRDIPDDPSIESERRQIFFASAAGVPTVFIRNNTRNMLLRKILPLIKFQRSSRRYKGYIRVKVQEYRLGLLQLIVQDASDLIAALDIREDLHLLKLRLTNEKLSTHGKLISGIKKNALGGKDPLRVNSREFNAATEDYYRNELKQKHLEESLDVLFSDCKKISEPGRKQLHQIMAGNGMSGSATEFIENHRQEVLHETAGRDTLLQMIRLGLVIIQQKRNQM